MHKCKNPCLPYPYLARVVITVFSIVLGSTEHDLYSPFFDIFGFSQRNNRTLSHHARITPFILYIRCSGGKCQATESAVPSTVVAGALRSVVPVIGEDNEERRFRTRPQGRVT